MYLEDSKPDQAITWRTIFVGFLVVLIFIPFVVYSYTVTQATDLASDHSTIGAVFFLALLISLVNPVWVKLFRGKGLNRAELLTVFVMMIMPSTVATLGVSESLVPMLVGPTYHKSAGDRYQKQILPALDDAIVIKDRDAAREFMEGLPREEGEGWLLWLTRLRWDAFVPPLLRWALFLGSMHFTILCLITVFRKHWVERELLPFPLAQLPIMLTENTSRTALLPDLFRNRALYWGALLPMFISTLNGIHNYYPNFPSPGNPQFRPMLLDYRFDGKFNFIMFGFAYLLNVSALKGLWVWFLLFVLFKAVCHRFGIRFRERLGPFGVTDNTLIYHAGMGGIIAFTFFSIWVARSHLKDVFRKAFGLGSDADDSEEMMTYRIAVFGTVIGFLAMLGWLVRYGIPWQAAAMMLGVSLMIYISMSKIIAEVGLAECMPTGIATGFTISKLGPANIGANGVISMAPHIAWTGDLRTFPMANATNGARIMSEFSSTRLKRFVAFFGSIFIGLLLSFLTTYLIGNATGKMNTGPAHHARSLPRNIYSFSLEVLRYESTPWSPRQTFYIRQPSGFEPAGGAHRGINPDAPKLLSPAPRAVVTTAAPDFKWKPVPGTARYQVEIIDEEDQGRLVLRKAAEKSEYVYGGNLTEGQEPPEELVPGRFYRWRVRAQRYAGPNLFGWYATGGGILFTFLLLFLQRQFLWWPLPAVGFIIGGSWMMSHVWFPVLVAWAVKTVVLRYGGASAYRKSLPFFMGLITGQIFIFGIWSIIDFIFGKRGNKLFAF